MKVKPLKKFNKKPKEKIDNDYPTQPHQFKSPFLALITAPRGVGKSFLASRLMTQFQDEEIYDDFYVISPSWESNQGHFKHLEIPDENVYYPDKDAVQHVLNRIEDAKTEWENYLMEMEVYNEFRRATRNKTALNNLTNDELELFIDFKYIDEEGNINISIQKPKWRNKIIRPPTSILLMDDCLSSPALSQSEAFSSLTIRNRHLSPLKEPFENRQSMGLSVLILSQCYLGGGRSGGQGSIPRGLRENLTLLIMFRTKAEGMMAKIREEIGGLIDPAQFDEAVEYALQGKRDALAIQFQHKCPTKKFLRFTEDSSEYIQFEEDLKECKCKHK